MPRIFLPRPAILASVSILLLSSCANQEASKKPLSLDATPSVVSAAGVLQPKDDILPLTGPMMANGGAARVQTIKVRESESISKGQVLAIFDNFDKAMAEEKTIRTNIATKKVELAILEAQTRRYQLLNKEGSLAASDLEDRELKTKSMVAQLKNLYATLNESQKRAKDAVLRSPVNGYVLRIFVRDGGRDYGRGIMEVADTTSMEAEVQVDERDIRQIRMGQSVVIKSENKAFSGYLNGTVCQIGRKIARRETFGTNPRQASDSQRRVVEVRIRLSPIDSSRVQALVGSQVIALFQR